MTKNKTVEKGLLFLYLFGFFVMASTMALMQPHYAEAPYFAGPPDEHARLLLPMYICEHGVIPTGLEEEIRIPGYGFSYGLYNVFPYIVQGYAMRLASLFTDSLELLIYVARFVNVFFGTCMAWVVYRLAGRLFEDARIRWIFCVGVMFLPECLFVHTYVNTDSMNLLSTAMIVYAWVCAYQDGFNRKNDLWLSAGIILCALSYYNAYGFILSSIFLLLGYFVERRQGRLAYDWKNMLKHGLLISVLVLLGIGWWFARAYLVLDGDFLGLRTRRELAIRYALPEVNPLNQVTYQSRGISLFQMFRETDFWNNTFNTFVAAFGSLSILGSVWIYRFYKVFYGGAALACMVLPAKDSDGISHRGKRLFFKSQMLFSIVCVFALMIIYAYTIDMQRQGRYLLPAVVPVYYFLTRGIEKGFSLSFIPKWMKTVGTILLLVALAGICAWMIYGVSLPVFKIVNDMELAKAGVLMEVFYG